MRQHTALLAFIVTAHLVILFHERDTCSMQCNIIQRIIVKYGSSVTTYCPTNFDTSCNNIIWNDTVHATIWYTNSCVFTGKVWRRKLAIDYSTLPDFGSHILHVKGRSSVNLGTIQRISAWPLRKDDTHTSRSDKSPARKFRHDHPAFSEDHGDGGPGRATW